MTSEEKIALKAQYPDQVLKTANVTDGKGKKHLFVFMPLDRSTMDLSGKEALNSPTRSLEMQMVNSCVHGDKSLISTDDYVFRALVENWQAIQKSGEVELGEL